MLTQMIKVNLLRRYDVQYKPQVPCVPFSMLTQMLTSNVIFARAIYDADYIPPPSSQAAHPCCIVMHTCVYICIFVCFYICIFVYLCICVLLYLYICNSIFTFLHPPVRAAHPCIVMRVCIFVYLCSHMFITVYNVYFARLLG